MPSERVQGRIEQLLAEAEAAMDSGNWEVVRRRCEAVLDLDPVDDSALEYMAAMRRFQLRTFGYATGDERSESGQAGVEVAPAPPAPSLALSGASSPVMAGPAHRQLDTSWTNLLALVAALLVGIGSIGPWAKVLFVTKAGTEGDGMISLLLAVLVGATGLARLLGHTKVWVALVQVLAFAACLAIGIIDWADVEGATGSEELLVEVEVGWGLVLMTIAAGVGLVVSVLPAFSRGESGSG